MMKRKIITIDEEKCTGCGLCIPDCPEGALQILDGKARLVSDLFCDGLGACIGTCPEGAISVVEREAKPYNEKMVMETIIPQGESVIRAHLAHLLSHGQADFYNQALEVLQERKIPVPDPAGEPVIPEKKNEAKDQYANCPGVGARSFQRGSPGKVHSEVSLDSELRQWPIQLQLIRPDHQSLENADLVISADCVPFAYGGFHQDFLQGKTLIIFCPKLDADLDEYIEKLSEIFTQHVIRSVTVIHMEVPCCSGVRYIVEKALKKAGKEIQVIDRTISITGQVLPEPVK